MDRILDDMGRDMNMNLMWRHEEYRGNKDGIQYLAKAELCSRKPDQLLVSIHVRGKEYSIKTDGAGMSETERKAVARRLRDLNIRETNGRIQD